MEILLTHVNLQICRAKGSQFLSEPNHDGYRSYMRSICKMQIRKTTTQMRIRNGEGPKDKKNQEQRSKDAEISRRTTDKASRTLQQ